MMLVMATCSVLIFAGVTEAQTASVKEKLPDGSFIVAIEGVDYKAVSADTVRDILKSGEDLDRCTRARGALNKQIALYEDNLTLLKKDRDLADTQAQLERERALRFQTMFNGEQALRVQAEKLYRPAGRVTRFFENPFVQVAFKMGVPIAQSIITMQRE